MNQDKAVMIVLVTVMLAAASLEKVAAEEEWIPVNDDTHIPIDYDNSRFELRTEITDFGIDFVLWEYDDAEKDLMGWKFDYEDSDPFWRITGCNGPQPGGPIDKNILSSGEQIWTVWRSADNKLNVLCNGQDILRDFAPTNDDDEVTGCARQESHRYFSDRLDWQLDWDTKVATIYFEANNDIGGYPADNIKGYRIVPHPDDQDEQDDEQDDDQDDQDDEHDAWTSGVSGLMVSTLIAVIPFWRF